VNGTDSFFRKYLNYFDLLQHFDAKWLNKVWKLPVGFQR